MGTEEVELKLLQDYLDAAIQEEDPQVLAQKIAMYEKQLLTCKNRSVDFNVAWSESMVYYLKAHHKLLSQGFMEKTLRSTAQQSSGFDGLAPALLAQGREKSRGREAISLLDQAIRLYDDPDYRFMRANLHYFLKEWQSALKDVGHLLTTYSNDQKVYLAARKLQDEIETAKEKEKCFIATAVYRPTESAKIDILRRYRDQILLKSTVGKAFVSFYYTTSPSIAQVIAKSQILKSMIRTLLLEPIVKLVSGSIMQNKGG
jgi:tetratricopeptide (TPR) repeat protein